MSKLIRIDLIDPSPFAAHYADAWDRSDEHMTKLRASIKKYGINTPLHVYPTGERYELLAGHCRLAIAKELGWTEVSCDTRSTLDSDEARESYFIHQNIHGAEKPRELARAALLRHPDYTLEKVAGFAGVALGTVHTAKEMLMIEKPEIFNFNSEIENTRGQKRPRTYRSGKRKDKPAATSNGNGSGKPSRLKMSEDETPEILARKGLELEAQGATIEQAAEKVGVNSHTYARLKAIVLLADDADLKSEHRDAAIAARDSVNEGGSIKAAYESVQHVVGAKFGRGKAAGGADAVRRFQIRLASLERAVTGISAGCDALHRVDVPAGIPADKHTEWLDALDAAAKALREFRNRVKEA